MATSNKYDRQLRLWGAQGQRRLGESRVLLLGSDAAGVETMKNLVLPGCGNFTVVDDALVGQRDLGRNFFVEIADLGLPRAQSVTKNLVEMNPDDVSGAWVQRNIAETISDVEFLKKHTFVIANELQDYIIAQLSATLDTLRIPLIAIQTNGFYGEVRLQGGSHCIIESKPDRDFFDSTLRLRDPFEGLVNHCDSFDLESMAQSEDKNPLAHVPFVVILVKALQKWRELNGGKQPKTMNEKSGVRNIVEQWMTQWLEPKDRENFEEAISKLYWAFKDTKDNLPDNLETLFEKINGLEKLQQIIATESQEFNMKFWVMIAALQEFKNTYSFLPVDRKLPDMKSTSEWYINLKDVYQIRHAQDKETFTAIAYSISELTKLTAVITTEDIQQFLDNIYCLDAIKFHTLAEAISTPQQLEDFSENQNHLWYVAQRAVNVFFDKNKRFPGESDVEELTSITNDLKDTKYNEFEGISADIVKEYCRFQDTRLHNIAAFIGGVASQEAIKMITKQFIPINNTFVYNGITSEGAVYLF